MSALAPPDAHLPRTVPGWLPFLWNRVLFPLAPDPQTRIRPIALLLVLLLPAALLYPTRGYLLLEPDEGRYAQIAKEMHASGSWVVPTLQGEPYLDKPPLMYWFVSASYSAFGVTAAAARLVPAICVHLTVLLVYLIGRRSVGERAAFWAAILLAVSPGFVGIARLLLLDGLLTLCVTASVLCGFEAVRTGRLLWGWWLASAVCSGLGFLTKGPISEVLLFPPLFAFALLNGSTARVGWKAVTAFAAIVVAVNLPWYVAMFRERPEFLGYFFWEHNVMRFVKPFDHLQPVWFYVPILLGGFLPGVILGVGYLRSFLGSVPGPRSQAGGFWLLAGGWCVFFFSCSGSKLPTYILPAFPPLCLALGDYLTRSKWNESRLPQCVVVAFAAISGLLIHAVVPWYANERSPVADRTLVEKYVGDRSVPVFTYPRNVDSVAFEFDRDDLRRIRTKDLNQFLVDSHFRTRTVVLFSHGHSYTAFCEALPKSLRVAEHVTLKRDTREASFAEKLAGDSPWGLCDIAVIEPAK